MYAQQQFVGTGLGAGSPFKVLQKIQGSWVSSCVPIASRASSSKHSNASQKTPRKIDTLTITFTELKFHTVVYSDSRCLIERTRYTSRYAFTLGESISLKSGEKVYALDVTEREDKANAWYFYPSNILHMKKGQLIFGLAPAGEPVAGSRLKSLDYRYTFSRK